MAASTTMTAEQRRERARKAAAVTNGPAATIRKIQRQADQLTEEQKQQLREIADQP
jgi:ribosome recycling factor